MTLGPILAVRNVRRGPMSRTSADARYVVAEVQTKTSMGNYLELEITREAAVKLSEGITKLLDDGAEKWEPDDHE